MALISFFQNARMDGLRVWRSKENGLRVAMLRDGVFCVTDMAMFQMTLKRCEVMKLIKIVGCPQGRVA
jgi:hypothetical protein